MGRLALARGDVDQHHQEGREAEPVAELLDGDGDVDPDEALRTEDGQQQVRRVGQVDGDHHRQEPLAEAVPGDQKAAQDAADGQARHADRPVGDAHLGRGQREAARFGGIDEEGDDQLDDLPLGEAVEQHERDRDADLRLLEERRDGVGQGAAGEGQRAEHAAPGPGGARRDDARDHHGDDEHGQQHDEQRQEDEVLEHALDAAGALDAGRVGGGAGEGEQVPRHQGEEHARDDEERDGPRERDVAAEGAEGGLRGGVEVAIELHDGRVGAVPVVGREHEALALDQLQALVAVAVGEGDGDLLAGRRGAGEAERHHADVARRGGDIGGVVAEEGRDGAAEGAGDGAGPPRGRVLGRGLGDGFVDGLGGDRVGGVGRSGAGERVGGGEGVERVGWGRCRGGRGAGGDGAAVEAVGLVLRAGGVEERGHLVGRTRGDGDGGVARDHLKLVARRVGRGRALGQVEGHGVGADERVAGRRGRGFHGHDDGLQAGGRLQRPGQDRDQALHREDGRAVRRAPPADPPRLVVLVEGEHVEAVRGDVVGGGREGEQPEERQRGLDEARGGDGQRNAG